MKRIIMLLLACLLLVGCLPTPEQEYVVNKGDSTVEDKLSATPKTEENPSEAQPDEDTTAASPNETAAPLAPQRFPAHWTETVKVADTLTITVDADITQKADGLYPVFRTRDRLLSQANIGEMLDRLLPKPKTVYAETATKAVWTEEYRAWLERIAEQQAWIDAGRPDDGVDREDVVLSSDEIEEKTNWYIARIKEAPDEVKEQAVGDYRSVTAHVNTVYTLEDGEPVFVRASDDGLSFYRGCRGGGWMYTADRLAFDRSYSDDRVKLWHAVTLSREDAESMLPDALARAGLDGFVVTAAQESNLLDCIGDRYVYVTGGWTFTLGRDLGGYPSVGVDFHSAIGEDESDAVNAPILPESLKVFVNKDGICAMEYLGPKTVVGLENTNVELLPFETVQMRAINALSAEFAQGIEWFQANNYALTPEVYRICLVTQTVRVRDSQDYYEIPCWVILYDWMEMERKDRDNVNIAHEALILNAVDGSIVH